MSDLIDRQAAIDAIGEVHPLDYNAIAIQNRIRALPSAQRWIPVTERLPEDGQNVLVTVEGWYKGEMIDRAVDLATYFLHGSYIDGFETVNDWIEYGEWHVTAWMPLPKPYERSEDGETKFK